MELESNPQPCSTKRALHPLSCGLSVFRALLKAQMLQYDRAFLHKGESRQWKVIIVGLPLSALVSSDWAATTMISFLHLLFNEVTLVRVTTVTTHPRYILSIISICIVSQHMHGLLCQYIGSIAPNKINESSL